MIDYNLFQLVKDKADIVEVAKYYNVNLDKNNFAKCPFVGHNEKTASFSINPKKQIFKCFGCR